MTLGEKIQKFRKEAGMSQEEFAEQMGVSRQAVSRWERDNGYPETEKLIKISQLFHVSLDYLLNEKDGGEENSERIFQVQGWYVSREMAEGFLDYQKLKYKKISAAVMLIWGIDGALSYISYGNMQIQSAVSTVVLIIGILMLVSVKLADNPYRNLWAESLVFDEEVWKQLNIRYADKKELLKKIGLTGAILFLLGFLLLPDLVLIESRILNDILFAIGAVLSGIGACLCIFAWGMRRSYKVLVMNEEYRSKRR